MPKISCLCNYPSLHVLRVSASHVGHNSHFVPVRFFVLALISKHATSERSQNFMSPRDPRTGVHRWELYLVCLCGPLSSYTTLLPERRIGKINCLDVAILCVLADEQKLVLADVVLPVACVRHARYLSTSWGGFFAFRSLLPILQIACVTRYV